MLVKFFQGSKITGREGGRMWDYSLGESCGVHLLMFPRPWKRRKSKSGLFTLPLPGPFSYFWKALNTLCLCIATNRLPNVLKFPTPPFSGFIPFLLFTTKQTCISKPQFHQLSLILRLHQSIPCSTACQRVAVPIAL